MNPLKVLNSLLVSLPLFLITAQAAVLDATWNAATDIPVTAASYTATGNTVNLTLNHTPASGEKLTVVKNTGPAFIQGAFANLSQGQEVALTYSGITYQFLANYYGGTGNDLVLQWAGQRLTAWGNNAASPFGNQSNVPTAVVARGALSGRVLAIAMGSSHGLALCSNGTVAAWGNNYYGQLGNNGPAANIMPPVAVNTDGLLSGKTVVAVAAGEYHSLALCADGTLAAWGKNDRGQLGNNSTTNSFVPIAVNSTGVLSGKTVVAVSAYYNTSLALCSDGTVAAFGANDYGQLGNNSTTDSSVPVAVKATGVLSGKTVVAVASGYFHSLAICSDGIVAAWGNNSNGQLGNNSTTDSSVPVAVDISGVLSGKFVVAIAAGFLHSLALCSDGTVAAWGDNGAGQLGNNSTSDSNVPVAVNTTGFLSGKSVVAVAAGAAHNLALCSDGSVATWGYNSYGQLGINSTASSSVPVAVNTSGVLSGIPVTAIAARGDNSLALAAGLSNVSTLSNLTLSAGSLSPSFTSDTYTYTASVSNATTSMTVTPTVTDSTATAKVNGTAVASGTASQSIPLAAGNNAVQIEVMAQDGTTISTYTLTITRALSSVATLSELSLSSGTLSPGFAPVTRAYTASVANATTSMTVTPTATDSTATVQVNGTSITSGTASQLIPLAVGNNTVQIRVTAQNGLPMLTYTLTITRAASSVATLSGLSLSSCSISPGFAPETPTYTASVANATTSTTVTPTVTDSTATVHVNGTAVASGTVSQSIPLAVGNNTLHVKVIAEDGTTSSIYMLTITRAPSAVATLSDLSMSGGFLDQGFSPSVTSYTSSVENTVTSINVKPTLTDLTANAKVNEEFVNSGSLSAPIQLVVGTNTVQIEVAAQDGTTIRNYTLTITRAPSSVATLAGLWLSASNLSPGFSPSEFAYTASVENSVTSVKVTPVTSDSTAKVKVNGTLVASGMSSGSIPLEVGTNTITTLVTAQDGTSVKTYTIKVTRAKSPDATLSGLLVKTATLGPKFKPGTIRYTASVPFTTLSVKIKATASHGAAKIRINGRPVKSGTLSAAIPLEIGKNLIKVVVTAQNGSIKTYKITAVRARFLTAPKRPESLAPTMTKSPEESTVSKLILDGRTYLQLTTRRNTGAPKPVIEVSPNLVDWFSGARHTTTLVDDGQILRVRDNTPATPGAKRYIRASGD